MSHESNASSFTSADLSELSRFVCERWNVGLDRDWSVRAGTLEWDCMFTADHVVDCVFSYAFFLASRKLDAYPDYGELHAGPTATPADVVIALGAVTTMLVAVIDAAPPGTIAVIHQHPKVETGRAAEFAPRGGLELILHAHDVCSGLGIDFEPRADLCRRLFDATQSWPDAAREPTSDPWSDLLERSGRSRL